MKNYGIGYGFNVTLNKCVRCTIRDQRWTLFYKMMFFMTWTALALLMTFKDYDHELTKFSREASTLTKGANDYDLDVWVQFYMKDMKANGFNIDSLLSSQKEANIRFKKIGKNTIGRADGMFRQDIINIKINPQWWVQLTPAEKLFVIYHEAGHDFFYKYHGTSWIMSRSKKATGKITYERIYKMREEYFESIRNPKKMWRSIWGIGVPPRPIGPPPPPTSRSNHHICKAYDHFHLD